MSDTLANFKLEYEDMAPRKIKLKEGKTMSKVNKVTEAPKKVYAPSRLEVFKTVLIVAMFTAIVAFVGGMQFQKSHDIEIRNAVSAAQAPVAEAKK